MKKLILYFVVLFSITMAACTSEAKKANSDSEHLHAFLLSENKLYVIGEKHDYVFSGDGVQTLQGFLATKYAKSVLYTTLALTIYEDQNVYGWYTVYLDPKKVPQNEYDSIKKTFYVSFSDAPEELALEQQILSVELLASGKVVKLENRNELLAKYKLQKPLQAKIQYYKDTLILDKKAALFPIHAPLTIVGAAAGIVILPLALFGCLVTECTYRRPH